MHQIFHTDLLHLLNATAAWIPVTTFARCCASSYFNLTTTIRDQDSDKRSPSCNAIKNLLVLKAIDRLGLSLFK